MAKVFYHVDDFLEFTKYKKSNDQISLHLAGQRINDSEIKSISEVLQNSNIIEIYLECNEITDTSAEKFVSSLKLLHNLKIFNIGSNKIGVKTIEALAETFKHLPNLEVLNIGGNKIEDHGIMLLSEQIHHLSNLKGLYLGGNNITDIGITQLSKQLEKLLNLDIFFLDLNNIGNNGVKALLSNISNTNIKKLYVMDNNVTCDELYNIADLLKENQNIFKLELGNFSSELIDQYLRRNQETYITNRYNDENETLRDTDLILGADSAHEESTIS